MLKVFICDRNDRILDVAEKAGLPVLRSSIFDIKADAVVSPANSFGFMDGGIDGAYTWYFGPELQANLQAFIKNEVRAKEVLIGEALVIIS